MLWKRILGIFLIFVGIILLIYMVSEIIYAHSNSTIEEGDCYDNNGNLIQNLTCEVETYPRGNPYIKGLLAIPLGILFGLGIVLLIYD